MPKLIDTNVILRLLVPSDKDQVKDAREIVSANECLVTSIVVAEVIWVLIKVYGYDRKQVAILTDFLSLKTIHLEEESIILKAIEKFVSSKFGFVDCFLLARSKQQNLEIITFDKKLQKAS